MKVRTFLSFVNESNAVPSLVDELDNEIASAQMRVGPTMDKLPWAMDEVVFTFLKDRTVESNSAHGNVDIESIVKQLEAQKESIKSQALEKIQVNAGSSIADPEPEGAAAQPKVKILKLKDYHLKARPISHDEQPQAEGQSEPVDEVEKAFRHSRNRGRNIMRKSLSPETFHKPAVPQAPQQAQQPVAQPQQPTLTTRPIQ